MALALQPFWLYFLDLIPIPQRAPSTFYALRRLRSYDPTKSGWTSGNVLFIHLNIVHAIESRRYDVVRSLFSRPHRLIVVCLFFYGVGYAHCMVVLCLLGVHLIYLSAHSRLSS
jgi:hypothetical protein